MLQAQSSAARDWSYPHIPAQAPQTKKARRTVTRVNHKRKIFIKVALALFTYSLVLVTLCIQSATLGYEIGRLEQDIQGMTTANQRLEYEIAEKSSLAHVEQAAISQLGMYKPDTASSIAMAAPVEPVSIAVSTHGEADNMSVSEKLLDNLYASLSRLAANK